MDKSVHISHSPSIRPSLFDIDGLIDSRHPNDHECVNCIDKDVDKIYNQCNNALKEGRGDNDQKRLP